MKRPTVSLILFIFWLTAVVGWRIAPSDTAPRVREPAVAGLFYPRAAAELAPTIDRLLGDRPADAIARDSTKPRLSKVDFY